AARSRTGRSSGRARRRWTTTCSCAMRSCRIAPLPSRTAASARRPAAADPTTTSTTCPTRSDPMRRPPVSVAAVVAVVLGAVALGQAAVPPAEEEARRFVQQTIDDVLGVLHDDTLSLEQKKDRVESIAYERFDFELISRLVLARN